MKQLIIDQIEVTQNGTIQLRMNKLSSDGDMIGYHRTAIEPGGDIDAQVAAVNAHMGGEGYSPISAADVAKVKAAAQAIWTPQNIAPISAAVTQAIAEQATARATLEAETAAHEAAKAASEQAKADADKAKAESDAAIQAAADAKVAADAALAAQAEAARLVAEKAATIPTISKKQGRAQLKADDLLLKVEGYIASLPVDDAARMAYEDSSDWVRTDPNIEGMMKILGKTDADADAFFAAALKL